MFENHACILHTNKFHSQFGQLFGRAVKEAKRVVQLLNTGSDLREKKLPLVYCFIHISTRIGLATPI